jgi:23S rRNA (cytidine1920-2'-O)/16S rRNA (cytidine1409-2'-O)-methyltransferase
MSNNLKKRLDVRLVELGLVASRSQAESYIKLATVKVDNVVVNKPGYQVSDYQKISLLHSTDYVGRGALKLESCAKTFKLDFKAKNILDVGSSTGGFTDYALKHGANKVIAVELGSDQLHPILKNHPKIELHEKTDIFNVDKFGTSSPLSLSFVPDIIVIDLSFVSLRKILVHIKDLSSKNTQIIAMVKPQFEAVELGLKHKGVIKNETIRRQILKDFEQWTKNHFLILNKVDSKISGAKGNLERFYLLNSI